MEVGAFSWLSMSFYPAMFAPEAAAFFARFTRRTANPIAPQAG
jgi:hypothetical protein